VIDHPAGTSIFPDERFATSDPQPTQERLFFRDSLERINNLNERIYQRTSIPSAEGRKSGSSRQPFFVSRTRFENQQYTAESIASVLKRSWISAADYRKFGIFVLRSVVMNPWHFQAEEAGMNYLFDFVRYLHDSADIAMDYDVRETANAKEQRRKSPS
jgi:hypothetical protein